MEWDAAMNWHYVLPPNRPSRANLTILAAYLARIDRGRPVCVLGTTIEILDLLNTLGFEDVQCVDQSCTFNSTVNRWRRRPITERLVTVDWLAYLDSHPGEFAAILSDFTLGNVPFDLQPDFLRLVGSALAPDGLFLDRVLEYRSPLHTWAEIDETFRGDTPLSLQLVNDFNAFALFCGPMVAELELVDSERTYMELRQHFPQGRVSALTEACAIVSPPGARWYYGRAWSSVEKYYSANLSLVVEHSEPADSVYLDWAHIRVSAPKGG